MSKILVVLFFFTTLFRVTAQILPAEGSKLNYRLIGFSFPKEQKIISYKIEIAAGNYHSEDSFRKNVIKSIETQSNKVIGEAPLFGSEYTWQVIYANKKKRHESGPLHHFSTLRHSRIDTSNLRLRILHPSSQYKDDYVSVDAGSVLYDMNGNPVWFLPDTNGLGGYVEDIRFTSQGTITFIYQRNAYEVNLNGDILWKAPNNGEVSGDATKGEVYHHEFTRLSNGHYMVLGTQYVVCKRVISSDTSYVLMSDEKAPSAKPDVEKMISNGYNLGVFGTIIEYDGQGNVVWSWKSSKYIAGSDFAYMDMTGRNRHMDPHDNTFLFDKKNKCIYLGYKNINRIIKIEYPDGKVLNTYGDTYKPGLRAICGGLFCNLHNISRSQDGYLYFFNNNSCGNKDSLPTVVMLQEPVSPNDSVKKIWEYTCTVEGDYPKQFGSGGSVSELPDHSLFVDMGSGYSKLFIVNRDKRELWSALPERFVETDKKWVPMKEYRANIISREILERLIWNAERP